MIQLIYSLLRILSQRMQKLIPREYTIYEIVLLEILKRNGDVTKTQNELQVSLAEKLYFLRRANSDLHVFNQIILMEEYSFLKNEFLTSDITIVDCGANIGLTTMYLKSLFPAAKVICIEPDPGNISQLKKNISLNELKSIFIFEGGVWSREGKMRLSGSSGDSSAWALTLHELSDTESATKNGTVKVDTLPNILSACDVQRVDILKIDIEGAEFELFKHEPTMDFIYSKVRILAIEIHETVGSINDIISPLIVRGFKAQRSGELWVFRK